MTNGTDASAKAASAKGTASDEAAKAGETIADEAKAVAGQAKELGREHAERRFEQGKQTVEGQVDAIGSAVGDAAERLRRENNPLASYAEELSGQLSRFSSGIENTSIDDLAVKTRRLARDNPGLFMLGSVVAGLAAARFFKASAEKERAEHGGDHDDYDHDDRGYADRGHGEGARLAGGSTYGSGGYRSPTADIDRPHRDSGATSSDTIASPAGTAADRVPFDSGASTVPPAGGSGTGATGTVGTGTSSSGVGQGGTSGVGSEHTDNKGAN